MAFSGGGPKRTAIVGCPRMHTAFKRCPYTYRLPTDVDGLWSWWTRRLGVILPRCVDLTSIPAKPRTPHSQWPSRVLLIFDVVLGW